MRGRLTERQARRLLERRPATVEEAVRIANAILPWVKARKDSKTVDVRWAAVEVVASFLMAGPLPEKDAEAIWDFAAKWGRHRSADLRAAIGVGPVEDLLHANFDYAFPRMERLVRADERFA